MWKCILSHYLYCKMDFIVLVYNTYIYLHVQCVRSSNINCCPNQTKQISNRANVQTSIVENMFFNFYQFLSEMKLIFQLLMSHYMYNIVYIYYVYNTYKIA